MTPVLFFEYISALVGGCLELGVVLILIYALYVFARGLMMQGDRK